MIPFTFVAVAVAGISSPPTIIADHQGRQLMLPAVEQHEQDHGGTAAPAGIEPAWAALGPFGGNAQVVAPSPVDSSIVLAGLASSGGVGAMYRSTDAGQTWTSVPSLDGLGVYDIAFAPDGTAYAGTIDGVWVSTDAGQTFTAQDLGIGANDQTFAIEMDPTDPDTLFVGVADAIGSQPVNVMRTTNGGATWEDVTPPMAPMSCNALLIDPTDASVVYAGFAGAFGGGAVWVSTNLGDSWINRSAGLPATPVQDFVHDGSRVLVTGGQLFGGQDFGVFASTNVGQTWTPLHDGSWPVLAVNALAIDPNDSDVLLAGSVGQGVFRSEDGGQTWEFGIGGSGALSLNDITFAPGSSTVIYLGASSIGVLKSDDGGGMFTPSSNGIGVLNTESVAVNPLNADEMAVAFQGLNDGGVYTSLDAGATWTLEPLPGTRYNTVAFAPGGTLYAISDGPTGIAPEGVYRREGDGTWTSIGPDQGGLFESELFPIAFSESDPSLIMTGGADFGVADFEPTIWRSTDAGATWTKVYEGPVDHEDVSDIGIVDGDQKMLASFTDFGANPQTGGVLVSSDNGQTWAVGGAGLDAEAQPFALAPVPGQALSFRLADADNIGGGVWLTQDAGLTWTKIAPLNARGVASDPNDPQVVFITQFNDPLVLISEDGANTFDPFVSEALDTAGFVRDLVTGGGRLLLASSTGVFATPLQGCPADFNGDGAINILDFVAFQVAFGDQDAAADCDDNGQFNVLDFICFQGVFQAGCP